MKKQPTIGITIGDLNGVGPEVIIKTLADARVMELLTPVIYGSGRALSFYKKALNAEEFNYSQVRERGRFRPNAVNVVNCWEDMVEIAPGKASRETGRAAGMAIRQGASQLKEGLIDALVTAPIDKSSIFSDDFPHRGHTEFLRAQSNGQDPLMIMVQGSLRLALLTEHIPLREVASRVTVDLVMAKLGTLEKSLRLDFGVAKPRIAVLGLNPHAGDHGLIGDEEEKIIMPAVSEKKNNGKLVFGPFPADGFFGAGEYLKYDAILAMYHDQGLIPFKTIAFSEGVNFTAGLPIIRTSPDHGTAYPIAGKGVADETSFRNALFLAKDIVKQREVASG